MANKLQLLIYRLSAAAPLTMAFAVVWYMEKKTILLPVLCAEIGLIIIVIFVSCFMYGRKHLSPVTVNVVEITPKDSWIIGYVISYLLPFVSIALPDINYHLGAMLAILIIIAMPFVNSATPNPLLWLMGYHFYSIGTENGIKDYLLISKRTLRNKNQIQSVKRLFEYFLIDERR